MNFKKTKIVCTIGPSSWDPKVLKQLAQAGMNVARLNFSHGTHEEKEQQIGFVRQISQDLNKPIAVMADLQGPKLRLGLIEGTRAIKKGEKIQLTINPLDEELPMQFDLSPFVKKGERVYLNDGLVELKVVAVKNKVIETEALNDGIVSSNKGCNVPETHLKGAAFTQKDYEDAVFALKQKVDYLALSFVQTVKDLEKPKELIKKYNPETKIIVKVEKTQAIENLEEIVKESDAIMVARGDLAIETNAAEVPVIQQKIIRLCRQYQKPVIVATQMLESMIENPRPTRAEASDVANAVLDQVDAVMLSAESASGKYPVETVQTMKQIIMNVEKYGEYKRYHKIDWEIIQNKHLPVNAITSSAASMAYRIGAKVIVVATATGRTANLLTSFRPNATIIAVTHDEQTYNQLSMLWGVKALIVKPTKNSDEFWEEIVESLKENDFAKKGDTVVAVSGATVGMSGGTDSVRVVTL